MDTAPRLLPVAVVAVVALEVLAIVGLVLAVLTGPDPATLVPAVLGVVIASVTTVLVLTHVARRRLEAAFGRAAGGVVVAGLVGAHGAHRYHDGGSGHDPGWWQSAPHDHGWQHHPVHDGGWTGCDPGSPSDHGSSDTSSSCSSDSGSSGSSGGGD